MASRQKKTVAPNARRPVGYSASRGANSMISASAAANRTTSRNNAASSATPPLRGNSIAPPAIVDVSIKEGDNSAPSPARPPSGVDLSVTGPPDSFDNDDDTNLRNEALSALDAEFSKFSDDEDVEALLAIQQEFSGDDDEKKKKGKSPGESLASPSRADLSIRDGDAAATAAAVHSAAPPSRVDVSMIVESPDQSGLAPIEEIKDQTSPTKTGRHASVGSSGVSSNTSSSPPPRVDMSIRESNNPINSGSSVLPPSRQNMSMHGTNSVAAGASPRGLNKKFLSLVLEGEGEEEGDEEEGGDEEEEGEGRLVPEGDGEEEGEGRYIVKSDEKEGGGTPQTKESWKQSSDLETGKDFDAFDEDGLPSKKQRRMVVAWLIIILALCIIITSIIMFKPNLDRGGFSISIPVEADKLGENLVGYANLTVGKSLDLSGDGRFLAVGSSEKETSGTVGQVEIMEFDGGKWERFGNLITGFPEENFGSSVQLSSDGKILVAGASGPEDYESDIKGKVRTYEFDEVKNEWKQFGIDIEGDTAGDAFGVSLSLSEDATSWIVGADMFKPSSDSFDLDGYSKVYELIDGEWVQKGKTITGSNDSRTGTGVAMSGDGDTICVGDRWYKLDNGSQKGRARCFEWDGTGWASKGSDIVGTSNSVNGQMGYSISLSKDGNRVAVGNREGGDNEQGSVSVFEFTNGQWQRMGLEQVSPNRGDRGGTCVKLNSDGNVLVWSAIMNNRGKGVVLYATWDDPQWKTEERAKEYGRNETDYYGSSIALDADGKIVAASAHDGDREYVNAFKLS